MRSCADGQDVSPAIHIDLCELLPVDSGVPLRHWYWTPMGGVSASGWWHTGNTCTRAAHVHVQHSFKLHQIARWRCHRALWTRMSAVHCVLATCALSIHLASRALYSGSTRCLTRSSVAPFARPVRGGGAAAVQHCRRRRPRAHMVRVLSSAHCLAVLTEHVWQVRSGAIGQRAACTVGSLNCTKLCRQPARGRLR